MIFLSNSQGTIVASSPGTLHQGSINANEIILLAPFTSTATVQASFRLPGGLLTYPRLLEVGDTEGAQEEYPYTLALGEAFAGTLPDGFNLWKMTMDKALTERAGTLGISFIITTPEWRITTDEATTEIIKGGAYISPSVSEDGYSEITKILSATQNAQENAEKAQENAEKAASTAQWSEQHATTISKNMSAYVERVNTHDRQISKVQGDITSLDARVKDLEAINIDYLEVEGDSDTGIVQVPSGFWVGSRAFVNSFGGKTYKLGHLPDNMITYNEQFGHPVDLGEDVIATIENGNLKTLSAGYLYVIKPGITVNTTKSVHIVTWLTFAKAATFSIKQSPEADFETIANTVEHAIHNDGQSIILFMESEATITSIRFTDFTGKAGNSFVVEPIMYESFGIPKSEEDYNLMNTEQQSYCIPNSCGDDYGYFPDWCLDERNYKPPVYNLSDTKIIGISSHGANLVEFPYINGVGAGYVLEQNGLKITVNADGSLTVDGTATARTDVLLSYIDLPAGDYILKCNGLEKATGSFYVFVSLRNRNDTTLNIKNFKTATPSEPAAKFTVTQEDAQQGLVLVWLSPRDGVACDNVTISPMLNIGTSAVPFTPYRAEPVDTIVIPYEIQNLPSYGKGVSLDYYNKMDLENNIYTPSVKTLVFDGTEDWQAPYSTSDGGKIFDVSVSENPIAVIPRMMPHLVCNQYDTVRYIDMHDYCYEGISVGTGMIRVFDKNYATADVSQWKAHLAELHANGNPLTVTYALDTPLSTEVDIDGFIEVEPGGYIEVETDTGRGAPIGVTFVVSKE